MKQISVGILGAGRIGRLHAENIKAHIPSLNLKAIADPCLDLNWAEGLNIPMCTHDPNAIMEDPNIDAVLICSPVETHLPLIQQALGQKKHIFCEKPLAEDVASIPKVLKAVQEAGVLLQVGFNRRFDANFSKIQKAVADGDIGTPYLLHITSMDPALPSREYLESAGGMFVDMSIHDFDMAEFIMGDRITEVYVEAEASVDPTLKAIPDVDVTVISLKFSKGALGIINNCRQTRYGYDQRLEILGSRGLMRAENETERNTYFRTAVRVEHEKPKYFFLERYRNSFVEELKVFAESIWNGTASAVSGQAGLRAVGIAKAAAQSWKKKKPVAVALEV